MKKMNGFGNNGKNFLKEIIKNAIISLKPDISTNYFRNQAPHNVLLGI